MDEFDANNLAAEIGEMSDASVLAAYQQMDGEDERADTFLAEIERRGLDL
jgi:hypothetical protein